MRGERLEFVGGAYEWLAAEHAEPSRHARTELGMRVQAGADGGASERKLRQVRQRALQVRQSVVELRRPAAQLLAEAQRRGVHQMRASDLHDLVERAGLRRNRRRQRRQRRLDTAA